VATEHEGASDLVICSDLGCTDDALLALLLRFAKGPEKEVLNSLRSRQLYRRIAVLTGSDTLETFKRREKDTEREEEEQQHRDIYRQFKTYRQDGLLDKIEELREKWEDNIVQSVRNKLPANAPTSAQSLADQLDSVHPLILVDVPVKNTKRTGAGSSGVRFLTEDSSGVHPDQNATPTPNFETARVSLDDEDFDRKVGKIRVFAHPQYRDLIVATLNRQEILSALR